jgi:hypothetical protein
VVCGHGPPADALCVSIGRLRVSWEDLGVPFCIHRLRGGSGGRNQGC